MKVWTIYCFMARTMVNNRHTPTTEMSLWTDAVEGLRFAEVKQAAVDTLVEQYTNTGGHCFVYGRDAWTSLCDVVKSIFGEIDGEKIVDTAHRRLKNMYVEPSARHTVEVTHNHWRVWHIETQLKALTRERETLLNERDTWKQ